MQVKIAANKPYFTRTQRSRIGEEIKRILESGRLTQGPWVKKFEDAFAAYIGAKYAIATNSGTSALEILLRYFDVSAREVIVPTNTFIATGNAVIFAGGVPVRADISPQTLCIDPREIQRHLSPKTQSVIVVHIAGLICPHIDEIRKFCGEKGLFLIEDVAHAPGASIDSRKAGVLADGAAFSFYPSKPLTTGEGGMITTDDAACARFARSVRSHGISTEEGKDLTDNNLLVRAGYTRTLGIPEQNLFLFNYQVRKLEYQRQEVLEDLIKLKKMIDPEMVFLPCANDLHQDHITVYNEGLRAFKHCTVLGYELPWNNITFHTRHFVFLQERHVAKKFEALRCYCSQAKRHYVNEDFIYGLARTRGVQLGTQFAEAFDVIRWVLA